MVVAVKKHRVAERVARAAEAVVHGLEQRRMLSAVVEDGVWYVDVDNNRDHAITIEKNPNHPGKVRAIIDGQVAGSAVLANIEGIEVTGGRGNDTITINLAHDDYFVAVYAGGGNDTIIGSSRGD